MSVSFKHIFSQGPVLRALGSAAITSVRPKGHAAVPGPVVEETIAPRSADLVRDYVRHVGGDPGWYRGVVPAHLFPQWGFPLAAKAIAGLPYPLTRVMNAGCRIEQRAPLPANEALNIRAQLVSVDDDGRRALITTSVITGTKSAPDALACEIRAYVPLAKANGKGGTKTTVPLDAREIAGLRIAPDAGLDFAKLTGDFNPIHWVPAYARAAGFRGCILHGFGTMARAIEALNRAVFSGDPRKLHAVDVRFSRPLPLPAKPFVYTRGNQLFVADAPGAGPYLEGTWS
ncbi:MAG: MaoC/PaaZ C-terminal domain-containing protein [Polyangiales bacterium]